MTNNNSDFVDLDFSIEEEQDSCLTTKQLEKQRKMEFNLSAIQSKLNDLINPSNFSNEQLIERAKTIQGYVYAIAQDYIFQNYSQASEFELENSNNVEAAEIAILHLCMVNSSNYETAISVINSSDFFSNKHQELFEVIGDVYSQLNSQNPVIDFDILIFRINDMTGSKGMTKLEILGGSDYLYKIFNLSTNFTNFETYLDELVKQRIRRNLHKLFHNGLQKIHIPGIDFESLISDIQSEMSNYNLQTDANHAIENARIDNIVNRMIKLLTKRDEESDYRVETPFDNLNEGLQQLKPGTLNIIAGRPGKGKSTFAMNICNHLAFSCFNQTETRKAKPVVIFSLEMKAEEISLRMLSSMQSIHMANLNPLEPDLNSRDVESLATFKEMTQDDNNMYIFDDFGITIEQIRARVRKVASNYDGQIGAIMIDYIQLVNTNQNFNSRNETVGHISRTLKIMSNEFNCPVLGLSQLSRAGTQRGEDAKPINSDLRDSGSLEQDADTIIMIHSSEPKQDDPEYANNMQNGRPAEAIITKNRSGPVGTVNLLLLGHYAKFIQKPDSKFIRA